MVAVLVLVFAAVAFAAGYVVGSRRSRQAPALPRETSAAPPAGPALSEPAAASTSLAELEAAERARAAPTTAEPASPEPATPDPATPALEPLRIAFTPHPEEGTAEWQAAMGELGARMRSEGVRLVVFAHGSFVGDDPLALARLAEDAVPALSEIPRKLRGLTRSHVSRILGDLSNFTPEYVEAFARATGIEATLLTWSGENHHAARVQGAVRLARHLALHGGGVLRPGDRALLVGHSHGGQLFAVLSQLVARASGYEELAAAAEARGEDAVALEEHLALLRRVRIDVATFGTPLRYGWARAAAFRLLHVVNAGGEPAAQSSLASGLVRQGDYVQRLGIHGSDFPAPATGDRAINARLDRVLGRGTSLRLWLQNLARGSAVATEGQTVLVDYGHGASLSRLISTGLGHGSYTRREAMLFHARLLADHFYPARSAPPPLAERLRLWLGPKKALAPTAPRGD